MTKLLLILLVFFSLQSCISYKTNSTKSAKKLYKTFFVGEFGTQYFISPLLLKSDSKLKGLQVDITFRYKSDMNTDAILNFSLSSDSLIKNIDSLIWVTNSDRFNLLSLNELYSDKRKQYHTRISTKLDLKSVKTNFNTLNWTFIVYTSKQSFSFVPTKKTIKSIPLLNKSIFELID